MTISIDAGMLVPIISIAAGILIFIKPKLLSYIVASYLVIVGVLGLLGY